MHKEHYKTMILNSTGQTELYWSREDQPGPFWSGTETGMRWLSSLLLLLPCRQEEWDSSAAVDSYIPLLIEKPAQTLGPRCCLGAFQHNCLIVRSKEPNPRAGIRHMYCLVCLGLLLIMYTLVTDRSKQNTPVTS